MLMNWHIRMIILPEKSDEIIKLNQIEIEFEETKEYIKSIFIKYLNFNLNGFNESYTLKYINANNKFDRYQDLADELLFMSSLFPESLNYASKDYYKSIGKLSYYKCFKILNGQWPLFEELSDKFDYFTGAIYLENVCHAQKQRDDSFLV